MTTLLLERPASAVRARTAAGHATLSLWPATDGGLTLDDLITDVWEGLTVGDDVRCPACDGAMAPCRTTGAAGARPLAATAGVCRACGTGLS